MEEQLKANLKALLDAYIANTDQSITAVARASAKDGAFFTKLFQTDKSCTISKLSEVVQWFSDNWPGNLAWPDGFTRPAAAPEPCDV